MQKNLTDYIFRAVKTGRNKRVFDSRGGENDCCSITFSNRHCSSRRADEIRFDLIPMRSRENRSYNIVKIIIIIIVSWPSETYRF